MFAQIHELNKKSWWKNKIPYPNYRYFKRCCICPQDGGNTAALTAMTCLRL